MSKIIWKPNKKQINQSNIKAFIDLNKQYLKSDSYNSLLKWSIDSPECFWLKLWDFLKIKAFTHSNQAITKGKLIYKTKWFESSTLNYSENLLSNNLKNIAIISYKENGEINRVSWELLKKRVASFSNTLRGIGIKKGDRVASVITNTEESVVCMLATASIGAIWSSCSPEFGTNGIIDRFKQIKPKLLISVNGYSYNGKIFDISEKIEIIANEVKSIKTLIIIHNLANKKKLKVKNKIIKYEDAISNTGTLFFEKLNFSDPLFILFSSGTTGSPKCIVHSVGGTLIQHKKEHILHCDIKPKDVLFFYTTCGWMMWNWLVTGLASKATILLYDGSPFYPDPNILWKIVDKEKIKIFGTSAKYLLALEKEKHEPCKLNNLDSLESILSTGSPLAPSSFDYVYKSIKNKLRLSSICGGTDIIACFAIGNPMLPVYKGELQCISLGMDVDIINKNGRSIKNKKGELVCRSPFPSMPIGFWGDKGNNNYYSTYFSQFHNIWSQGDYGELKDNGGIIIHGRSDSTLNPGGIRIGTSEIYKVVEKLEEISECLAVGQEWENDTRIILFVTLEKGYSLNSKLEKIICKKLREEASPRHVPSKIIASPELPRTINGKILEIAVREIIHGRPINNIDAIANPKILNFFRGLKELRI
ncbi:MAG: acetoacetate--CoA ligase [Pseudomonadota bacterium]|nr:acetoacetate--CoA ligase [Pseudomonadota bacterium]|tara:strand:- start:115 stop:2055 length:1941 start_codon:yes stop_codon:yes gene_type:complete